MFSNMDNPSSFRPMRRFKQQMTNEACIALLQKAPRGVLAVLGDGGYPYTVPLDLRLLGAKYFPQSYDIDADMAQDAPNAFVLELQIEHMSGKRVREK